MAFYLFLMVLGTSLNIVYNFLPYDGGKCQVFDNGNGDWSWKNESTFFIEDEVKQLPWCNVSQFDKNLINLKPGLHSIF